MTILVTGGAGFIGSNFILEWLAEHDEMVVNLDLLTYAGNPANLESLAGDQRYLLSEGDVADSLCISALLAEHRPRAIIHFAAESHVDRSIDGPAAFVQTNIVGTFCLLEAARAYWAALPAPQRAAFRFVHVSTDEVYGSLGPDGAPFAETNRYEPNSPYSASKAASDHLVRAWFHTFGLPVLTTNCSNNYGPLQYPEKLLPVVIGAAVSGRDIPVYGDGRNVRDWLYVADHCRAIMAVLDRGTLGEVYNIGGDSERANIDLVELICDMIDEMSPRDDGAPRRSQIRFVTDRPGHDRRYAIDARKIRGELGWQPTETFESGLHKTVKWYLENQQWCDAVAARRSATQESKAA